MIRIILNANIKYKYQIQITEFYQFDSYQTDKVT